MILKKIVKFETIQKCISRISYIEKGVELFVIENLLKYKKSKKQEREKALYF